MASEVDITLEKANATLDRVRANQMRFGNGHVRRQMRRMQRFALMLVGGVLALLIAAGVFSAIVSPLGFYGVMLVALGALAVVVLAGIMSREEMLRPEAIAQAPLPELADRTTRWLEQQRPALPAPAKSIADALGERIAALQPTLDRLGEKTPEAAEVRRLVSEELPELVSSYQRVPKAMRTMNRNGRVAETELVEGMRLLDREIDAIGRTLAETDIDRLASHKRYLELRYEGDETGSAS